MKIFHWISLSVLTFIFVFFVSPLNGEDLNLDAVLDRIDEAGQSLNSMKADITQKKWTDILAEFDSGETGDLSFLRSGQDLYLRKDITAPTNNSLVIKGGEVVFYQPGIKQAQQYQLGENKDKAEYLLLGFGTDKDAIKDVYDLELLGVETLNGSKTYKIQMDPKSEKVSAFFVRIVLWIDAEMWVPVQQKLVEPTQDYLLITFNNIRLNANVRKSEFDLKLPGDVKVIK
ncbi:MAG: outer membrane lipoprotein carrier protein LolA [Acidobacteriota bacterium]